MSRPVEVVIAALDARGCNPRGNPERQTEALCPAHEDRNPSLGVKEASDGHALVFCQAGCSYEEVLAALGLVKADLYPSQNGNGASARDDWTPEAEYVYTTVAGDPVFKVIRFPGKRFRQQRWTGSGYEWGMNGVERCLYRLPEVESAKKANRWIFLTEGEKDADAVRVIGQTATTMPGGAGKWQDSYTKTLTGANVIILADDDEAGLKHAGEVWRQLQGKAARVAVRLPVEGAKDIAAHLARGKTLTKADLRPYEIGAAELNGNGNGSVHRGAFTAAVFSSREIHVDEVLGPLFCRGMRTVVGAQTGEGKSTFVMQAVRCLVEGEPFLDERWAPCRRGRALIVDLEQGEVTVQLRLREAGLDKSEAVDILSEPNGIALDKRPEDRAMVRDILREGNYSMVVLDPLYQLHAGSGNDEAVAAETMRIVDGWAREFNVSLVVPMHARKPHPEAGLNFTKHDISGVGTWLRNAEVLLGLQLMFAGQSRMWFFKDRIGRGPEIQTKWWLDFDRESGFRRNHKEDRDKIARELKQLLQREEGATREELVDAHGADDLLVQKALTAHGKYQLGDRFRSRKWKDAALPGQETLPGAN